MKRFLRYLAYRELYRTIRKALSSSSDRSNTSDRETATTKSPESGRSMAVATEQRPQFDANPDGPATGTPITSPAQLKAVLQQMDPYEFEHFIAELWERKGWKTEVSAAGADKGVDIVARKSTPYDQLLLIQAKRYGSRTTVGSPDIQQYASLRHQYNGVDKVLIVTTNDFTSQAREMADRLNVKLIDGDGLVELLTEHDGADLVASYLDSVSLTESVPTASDPAPTTDDTTQTGGTTAETTVEDVDTDDHSAHTEDHSANTDGHGVGVPTTRWKHLITVSVASWIALFVLITALPDSLASIMLLLSWFGLPLGIFGDTRALRSHTDWPRFRWGYILTAAIPLFAIVPGILYLWRRPTDSK